MTLRPQVSADSVRPVPGDYVLFIRLKVRRTIGRDKIASLLILLGHRNSPETRSVHRQNRLRLERKLAWFNTASQVRRGSA